VIALGYLTHNHFSRANAMRYKLHKGSGLLWLLVISVAACVLLAGCKLFTPRDEPDSGKSADGNKTSPWARPLRDERALEVERNLGGL
jgi:hypothetical protein